MVFLIICSFNKYKKLVIKFDSVQFLHSSPKVHKNHQFVGVTGAPRTRFDIFIIYPPPRTKKELVLFLDLVV